MSLTGAAILTIALMAVVTYGTRIAGYLLLRVSRPGPRVERFLRAAPQTMFMALITPALANGGPAEWLGAATAVVSMLISRSLLASIIAATIAVALVRGVLSVGS